jgi:hypothetical protein
MHKLKEILLKYSGQDWKTLAFPVVLDACLKVPKLYEGSCIRELVARGLKLEPRTQGWINSEEFLSKLGA